MVVKRLNDKAVAIVRSDDKHTQEQLIIAGLAVASAA
jgi:hypothetical protein